MVSSQSSVVVYNINSMAAFSIIHFPANDIILDKQYMNSKESSKDLTHFLPFDIRTILMS